MVELSAETRKSRQQALVQPVTRYAAVMVLTLVNGRLELRPASAGPSRAKAATSPGR